MLSGESRLATALSGSGPKTLVLDPWTPMILTRLGNSDSVGATETGKTVVMLERASSTGNYPAVDVDWELRAHRFGGTQLRTGPARRRHHGIDA